MGLCLSVALWKEKAASCRAAVAGRHRGFDDDMMLGASAGYGLLRDGALEVEEEAVTTPKAMGGGVAAGGTPLRPIWQRRVLMGVKCQLPRFSGMIMYDERGQLVRGGIRDRARDQEKHAAAITVLREML